MEHRVNFKISSSCFSQNLVISRCLFIEHCKEMHQDLTRTCSLNRLFGYVLVTLAFRCGFVKLPIVTKT